MGLYDARKDTINLAQNADILPDPDVLAVGIIENLQSVMDSFSKPMSSLKK